MTNDISLKPSPLDDFVQATDEMLAFAEMVVERLPALAPLLVEKIDEMVEEMNEAFKPVTDVVEGVITWEEFQRICHERATAEAERRRQYYQRELEDQREDRLEFGQDEDERVLVVYCHQCDEEQEWDLDEMDGWPPIGFECKDLTGENCQDDD
jgi:hypothetical protein